MTLDNIKAKAAHAAQAPLEGDITAPARELQPTPDSDAKTPAIPDHAAQDQLWIWLKGYRGYWAKLLPDGINPDAFEASAYTALVNSDQLKKVIADNHQSFVYALAMCAHFGLMPDGVQAAIVPYKGSAGFIPMYRGYITLLLRHKVLASIRFKLVREGDTVELDNGKPAPDDFSHKVNLLAPIPEGQKERTPLIAYVYGWHPDGTRTEVVTMTRQEAEHIRNEYSESYKQAERKRAQNRADFQSNPWKKEYWSPWHTPTGEISEAMWLKSVVRQWVKRLDITPPAVSELVAADAADEATGQKVIVPGRVMRALAEPRQQVDVHRPHSYVHDDRTDPTCGLEGCQAYHDDPIHTQP